LFEEVGWVTLEEVLQRPFPAHHDAEAAEV
jgi:hypothetical protein